MKTNTTIRKNTTTINEKLNTIENKLKKQLNDLMRVFNQHDKYLTDLSENLWDKMTQVSMRMQELVPKR